MRHTLVLGLIAAWMTGCAANPDMISLKGGRFVVRGSPEGSLSVYVQGAADPIMGEEHREAGELVFIPRFPLREGLSYRAVYRSSPGREIVEIFDVPGRPASPPASVQAVYPSGGVLPENQLKFYIHFSAPMARGEAYRRIHLIQVGGREVEMPFLELGEELWDPSGTRFTLFFDPGRIKRGLRPREDLGPSLEAGKSYELVIDRDWPDDSGHPLREAYRKSFRAGPPDDRQPDPARWRIGAPSAGTRDPLVVIFEKSLDEAMLRRVMKVVPPSGEPIPGRIEIDQDEKRWRLFPEAPWGKAKYSLVVDCLLEDGAGNSIARPFEVDVVHPVDRRVESKTVNLVFEIRE